MITIIDSVAHLLKAVETKQDRYKGVGTSKGWGSHVDYPPSKWNVSFIAQDMLHASASQFHCPKSTRKNNFDPLSDPNRPISPLWAVWTRVDRSNWAENVRLAWQSGIEALGTGEIDPTSARFAEKKLAENRVQGSGKTFKMA